MSICRLRLVDSRACLEEDPAEGLWAGLWSRFDAERVPGGAEACARKPCIRRSARRLCVCFAIAAASPLALAARPASADACPNAAFRIGASANLPDCRAYEMVSPPFKGGWPAGLDALFPDGNSAVGSSVGDFSGETDNGGFAQFYLFSRGPAGWVTSPLNVPSQFVQFTNIPYNQGGAFDPQVSASGVALLPAHGADQSVYQADLYLLHPDGSMQLVGPMLPSSAVPATPTGPVNPTPEGEGIVGASHDLSRVIFSIDPLGTLPPGVTTNLWPGDGTIRRHPISGTSLYEYLGAGHAGTSPDVPALVGLDNNGAQISQCGTAGVEDPTNAAPGISSAASTVFFTAAAGGCGGTGPAIGQLYARIGDPGSAQATVNLAGTSGCVASAACDVTSAPVYRGASTDGSRVFFTTEQPLSASDHDSGIDLYACDLPGDSGSTPIPGGVVNPCPSIHPVSVSGAAGGSGFESVVALSADGSHAYFTATGVLTSTPNQYGATATDGANNLYVYERGASVPSGHVAFIGAVDSSAPTAQTTGEGRFLVFTDTSLLTPDDASSSQQVFRYDAQTGELIRVSIGDQGFNNDGNTTISGPAAAASIENNFSALPDRGIHPNISDDGSKIVFLSPVGLTTQALDLVPSTNLSVRAFAANVYEYQNGRVSLISDGQDRNAMVGGLGGGGIDGSGRNIFFTTASKLVAADTDGNIDVYDARIGGGFPSAQGVSSCQGDACQPFSNPPSVQVPGSLSFSGFGNVRPDTTTPAPSPPLSRVQKLAKALRACTKQPRRKRAACRARARKLYGPKKAAKRSAKRSRRGRS